MPRWRDKIFLATKAGPRGSDPKESARAMQRQFEESLRLLKTDHVDLLHIHNAGQVPTAAVLAGDGPLDWVRLARSKGQTRFIGLTGHMHVPRFLQIIETGAIDVIMVVLNFADYHTYRFEQEILPVARRHNCGILAMKVFGGRDFSQYRVRGPAKMPLELLERGLRYSLGIPGVTAAVVGPYTVEEVTQDVAWAKRYTQLGNDEMAALREQGKVLAANWGPTRLGPPV
jgi:predicted aldo/keto reductase-like oxidoreductase